ncbi:MAG TPA: DNA helicase RecQ [Candidatus Krumholzibacteria bacterium]|nr:DNA helicase RecQ [Candidatus Krumholzibacteria bacterium]HPD73247.1 DNA helicase RecQ [Candidatus Krumholzibacteria bacterium]HRY40209.1 DNA helicase RecQ [Candidatus Krumholzibacteria bacterium]
MSLAALDLLRTTFGYPSFRGAQAEIIDLVAGGGDAMVLMPTGGGKSLCYQIPALLRPGTGVVVSPLIALMQDQVAALTQLGLRAAFLNSTLSAGEATRTERQLRRGELDLLYIAPERLLQERTLALLDEVAGSAPPAGLALFAIDEAHCVARWGHDFRPEYLQLDVLADRYPGVPRLACTATADQRTREEILRSLRLEGGRVFVAGFDRPNIRYRVVQKDQPRQQLLRFLRSEHPGDAGIVYCLSRRKTEETAAFLNDHGIPSLAYHAGLAGDVRRVHQERFLREDGLVMTATIAFGMGIDKPDVRFVAHLDLPRSLEAYYQETGRAGRDGLPADAWLCYGLQDVVLLRRMLAQSDADEMHKRREQQGLDAMLGYCEVTACRRRVLLQYFGETLAASCGNCDTCLEPPDVFDGTVAAQKLLSCAVRTGQRFGAQHLIEVLRGCDSERLRQWRHDRLPTYGIGRDRSAREWRSVARQLVARGLLAVDPEGYGGLRVTDAARGVLRGDETLDLRRDLVVEERAPARAARKRRVAALAALGAEIAPPDAETEALFERLRRKRKELADAQGVPPYVILHDKTLAAMASVRPASPADLLRISGIGQAKLERYGEAFLAEINRVEDPSPPPPDPA